MKNIKILATNALMFLVIHAHADINFSKVPKASDTKQFYPLWNNVLILSNLSLEFTPKFFPKGVTIAKIPKSELEFLGFKKGQEIQSSNNGPYYVKDFFYMLKPDIKNEADKSKGYIILTDDEKVAQKYKNTIPPTEINGFAYLGAGRNISMAKEELVRLEKVNPSESIHKKIFSDTSWKDIKNRILKRAKLGSFKIYLVLERENRNMNYLIIEDSKGILYDEGPTKSLVSQDDNFLSINRSISNSYVLQFSDPYAADNCDYLTIIEKDKLSSVTLPCADTTIE